MWNTSPLPLLLGSLLTGEVVQFRVPPIGKTEHFDHLTVCKQINDVKLN